MSNHNNYTNYSKRNKPSAENATINNTPTVDTPIYGTVKDCLMLNIRRKPEIDSEIKTVVNAGSKLLIDDKTEFDDWFKVTTETGIEGFCMKDYIAKE